MKIILNIVILVLPQMGFCQDNIKNNLIGKWVYLGTDFNEFSECPEQLVFEENGSYQIKSECYAVDLKDDNIEIGNWTLDQTTMTLKIENRNNSNGGGYFIWNSRKTQLLKIKWIDDETIGINYFLDRTKSEVNEKWKRNKQ